MKSKPNDNKNNNDQLPDSSTKTARGSKSVHSEKDNSTEDGFKKKKGK